MMRRALPAVAAASLVALVVLVSVAEAEVRRVATGLDRPVFATAPPGDADRLFIALQRGDIRILKLATETLEATPFLTVTGPTGLATGNEQGLLGLAFHPDYATNRLFYVYYTETGGDSVIAEYEASQADPDIALTTETRLLTFDQPQANHNAGWIGFGPDDGYLYIASGDGGGGNDDDAGHTAGTGNGQDITDNLLGKILRIDVDNDGFPMDPAREYAVPANNPFVGVTGDDEIWSYGLRNPYRASFDRGTGDLYIGDVGQNAREEIDVQPAGVGGLNFGWRLREGTIATPGVGGPAPGATDPVYDYPHSGAGFAGCSVTGGVVYRGPLAALDGIYFFGDYCTGDLWSFRFDGVDVTELTDHSGDPDFAPDQGVLERISGFGEDDAGNLYILKLGTPSGFSVLANTGDVFVVPEPSAVASAAAALATLLGLHRRRANCV
jgi:glucose/arabinose dehydrogenase